jgi:hypothetical protein
MKAGKLKNFKTLCKRKIKTQALHLAVVPVNLGYVCSSIFRSLEEGVIEWCPIVWDSCYTRFTVATHGLQLLRTVYSCTRFTVAEHGLQLLCTVYSFYARFTVATHGLQLQRTVYSTDLGGRRNN